MSGYVELHCHSNLSLLDGACHPEELAARAAGLQMPALAITDHDGLYGAIKFYKSAKALGVKPIIGAELTLDREHHIILLAKTLRGYSNLSRLITRSQMGHSKGEATTDFAAVAAHSEDLICLSGCRKGEIASALLAENGPEAERAARRYLHVFGDRFFIELQNNLRQGDARLCRQLSDLASRLGIECVATNNVHYATPEGRPLQDVLACIRNRTTLDRSAGLRHPNDEFYLKPAAEMAALFSDYPRALENSLRIADLCNVDLNFTSYRFPDFPLPPGETDASYLARLSRLKASERYGSDLSQRVKDQITYELALIEKLDLSGYFLIVWDIMAYAKANGIPAQGRGSAANSIIAYILGITRVDPIRHNLFVGRFINEEMSSIPDIDIDVSTNHRERLIQYVYQKYGQDHTAMVCTYVTFQARNAIREVGKVLGMPAGVLDRMAKTVGGYSARDLDDDLGGLEKFRSYVTAAPWQHFISLCKKIADFPRHLSIHVGGMIISSCPLVDIVPLEKAAMPGRVVCQWDKDGVEDAGLVKVDILGLRMLSLIDEEVEMVKKGRDPLFDIEKIPLDDARVYDMICEADTLGVFQVESRAQMQTLPRTRPRSIEDLTVEVAIIRPGPLQGHMVHPYIRRRQGKERVTYPHPKLKPILEETNGVILFQEQVLRAAIAVAGFSPGEADSLRRAMSRKRSREAMDRIKVRFLEGAARNHIGSDVAGRVFDTLKGFAEYGFCKSHAAGFALLAYQSAWLKYHYPAEFYAALLNNQPMGFYSPEVVVGDARRHGIEVLPVDINRSLGRCAVENGKIRLGFIYIKEMGETAIAGIERARAWAGFTSLDDFYQRTKVGREAMDNLIMAGAMDCFGAPKRRLLWDLGLLEQAGRNCLKLDDADYKVSLPAMTRMEELSAEYDIQGFSAGTHPMQLLREKFTAKGVLNSLQAVALASGSRVRTAGYVVCRQAPMTAKGFVFLTLEDEVGLLNVVLKPPVYQKHRYEVRTEPLLIIEGRVQKKEGITNIIADRVVPYSHLTTVPEVAPEPSYLTTAPRSRNFC